MKHTKNRRFARRAASLLLALLMLAPLWLPTARAARLYSTETSFYMWDKINDMQSIGSGADCSASVHGPVSERKYSRILFYQQHDGDSYYFNARPDGGPDPGWYSSYEEDEIYLDSESRVGHSAHSEWNEEFGKDHFLTRAGMRTPYLQYGDTKEGYHTWRLWAANRDDSISDYTLMLVDDYEDLDLRRTRGGYDNPHSGYGAKDDTIRSDPWIIDKHYVIVPAGNYKSSHNDFVIWHWDNDTGGYNETLDFDLGNRRFKACNISSYPQIETFKIYLGKEYRVGTLASDFTVAAGQTQTVGNPLYYIPKGRTITVEKDAALVIEGALINEGTIDVKDGGMLILNDNAAVFSFSKHEALGTVKSVGSIYIGQNAVLSANSKEGIQILGGGVVNYGILAAEAMTVSKNYALDNRMGGWIVIGYSPKMELRTRYVESALTGGDRGVSPNPQSDFVKLGSFNSFFEAPYGDQPITGNTANVRHGENTKAVASATLPVMKVYTRAEARDSYRELFNAYIDDVSMVLKGDTAVYTVSGNETKTYEIKNKLVAASVTRDKDEQYIFRDKWVGGFDGAYLQLEPATAPGSALTAFNGNESAYTSAQSDSLADEQLWRFTESGRSGVNMTYRISNKNYYGQIRDLDLPGVNNAREGMFVGVAERDAGDDQRWIMVRDASGRYAFRNAANESVSLGASGGNSGVMTETSSSYAESQYWTLSNLLTENAYQDAISLATTLEFSTLDAPRQRLAVAATTEAEPKSLSVRMQDSDRKGERQRWRLEPAGSDDLDGVLTVYYRIVEVGKNLVLTRGAGYDTSVNAQKRFSGTDSRQLWYIDDGKSYGSYCIRSRVDSTQVLAASRYSGIVTTSYNGSAYQEWKITGLDDIMRAAEEEQQRLKADRAEDPLHGKTIYLAPKFVSKVMCVEGDANDDAKPIHIWDRTSSRYMIWTLSREGTDENGNRPYYSLINLGSEKVLGYESGKAESGQGLVQWTNDGGEDKHWFIEESGEEGYFYLVPRLNPELCADVSRASSANGTKVILYAKTGTGNQLWSFADFSKGPLEGKTYSLESRADPGRGATGYHTYFAVNLTWVDDPQYASETTLTATNKAQQWTFETSGWDTVGGELTPYYRIKNVGKGTYLVCKGKTNWVQMRTDVKGLDQDQEHCPDWYVENVGDGWCRIVSRRHQGMALALPDNPSDWGENVRLETWDFSGLVPDNSFTHWKLIEPTNADPFDGRIFTLTNFATLDGSVKGGTKQMADYKTLDGFNAGIDEDGTAPLAVVEPRVSEYYYWRFNRVGSDVVDGNTRPYYTITNLGSEKQVYQRYETNPMLRPASGDDLKYRLFYLNDTDNGCYTIECRAHKEWYIGDAANYQFDDPPKFRNYSSRYNQWKCEHVGGSKLPERDINKWRIEEATRPTVWKEFEIESVEHPGYAVEFDINVLSYGYAKLYASHISNRARWVFEQMGRDDKGEAIYRIRNKDTGEALSFNPNSGAAGTPNGSIVKKENYRGEKWQLWQVREIGADEAGKYYAITCLYYMDKEEKYPYGLCCYDNKDTRLELSPVWNSNGTLIDNLRFWRLNEEFQAETVGTYEVAPLSNPANRLGVSGYSLSCDHANSGDDQRLTLVLAGYDVNFDTRTPFYTLKAANGAVVAPASGTDSVSAGTGVTMKSPGGYASEFWFLDPDEAGYILRNRANDMICFTADGLKLAEYDERGDANQRWLLHPAVTVGSNELTMNASPLAAQLGLASGAGDTLLYPEVRGKNNLAPHHAAKMRLDIAEESKDSGAAAHINTNNGHDSQVWEFIPVGADFHDASGEVYYKIKNTNSGMVLGVSGYDIARAGSQLGQYEDAGCYSQQWYLRRIEVLKGEAQRYYLLARGTLSSGAPVCVEVRAGAEDAGSAVYTATLKETPRQQWAFDALE